MTVNCVFPIELLRGNFNIMKIFKCANFLIQEKASKETLKTILSSTIILVAESGAGQKLCLSSDKMNKKNLMLMK